MRTKALVAAAAAVAAGVVSTMAQSNVYSLNVVGYVNTTCTGGGKYTAVCNPLNTTNNTLAGVFGGAGVGLPAGSQVLKWNTGTGDFDTFNKTGFGVGWSPSGGATASFAPGEGALVYVVNANYTNTFVGEVLQGNLTNSLIAGYQFVSDKVPESGPVNTLQFTNVPTSSQLLQWNVGIQDWATFNKIGFGSGWSPSVPNLNVGEAVLLYANAPFTWVRNFTVQ